MRKNRLCYKLFEICCNNCAPNKDKIDLKFTCKYHKEFDCYVVGSLFSTTCVLLYDANLCTEILLEVILFLGVSFPIPFNKSVSVSVQYCRMLDILRIEMKIWSFFLECFFNQSSKKCHYFVFSIVISLIFYHLTSYSFLS